MRARDTHKAVRAHGLEKLERGRPFEVCIIGSGFAGTVLGCQLVQHGIRTLIVESGGGLGRWFVDRRLRRLAKYTVSGDAAYPTARTRAKAVGGTSNFWTGRCERLHPSDFESNPYTPVDNPWPIDYASLEPYYRLAERCLRVRGGEASSYAQPRGPLPIAPRGDNSSLKALLRGAGITLDDSPTATPTRAIRFFRIQRELLPGFLFSPSGFLVTGTTVRRVVTNGNGRVVGALCQSLDGSTGTITARYFVLAGGGIENPRLLLLSRSEDDPNGLGNSNGRVGCGFGEHPNVNFFGEIPHSRATLSFRHQIGRTHQLYSELRKEGLGGVLPVAIQSWLFPNHLLYFRPRDILAGSLRLLRRAIRPALHIGATIEMLPAEENRITLSRQADVFGDPLAHVHLSLSPEDRKMLDRAREIIRRIYRRLGAINVQEGQLTWSRHHMGACRMGHDPTLSVVDSNLRVHECENLYVCGCETFVTGSAVPPTLTIVALAHRLSDHLVGKLRRTVGSESTL